MCVHLFVSTYVYVSVSACMRMRVIKKIKHATSCTCLLFRKPWRRRSDLLLGRIEVNTEPRPPAPHSTPNRVLWCIITEIRPYLFMTGNFYSVQWAPVRNSAHCSPPAHRVPAVGVDMRLWEGSFRACLHLITCLCFSIYFRNMFLPVHLVLNFTHRLCFIYIVNNRSNIFIFMNIKGQEHRALCDKTWKGTGYWLITLICNVWSGDNLEDKSIVAVFSLKYIFVNSLVWCNC